MTNKIDRHDVRKAVRLAGFAIGLTVASFAGVSNASAAPVCPEGAGQTVVVDDQGVSQVACVAQAAAAPAPAASVGESRSFTGRTEALPETGTGTTVSLLLGTALVAAGVSASLAARRRNNTD